MDYRYALEEAVASTSILSSTELADLLVRPRPDLLRSLSARGRAGRRLCHEGLRRPRPGCTLREYASVSGPAAAAGMGYKLKYRLKNQVFHHDINDRSNNVEYEI